MATHAIISYDDTNSGRARMSSTAVSAKNTDVVSVPTRSAGCRTFGDSMRRHTAAASSIASGGSPGVSLQRLFILV